MGRSALDALYALYEPNVSGGPNFSPAIAGRSRNAMLASCILTLGLATDQEVGAEFKRRDDEHRERSQAVLDRANARLRGEADA